MRDSETGQAEIAELKTLARFERNDSRQFAQIRRQMFRCRRCHVNRYARPARQHPQAVHVVPVLVRHHHAQQPVQALAHVCEAARQLAQTEPVVDEKFAAGTTDQGCVPGTAAPQQTEFDHARRSPAWLVMASASPVRKRPPSHARTITALIGTVN